MRKWILAALACFTLLYVALLHILPVNPITSLASMEEQNLIKNGNFYDGIKGWQIVATQNQPQYSIVNAGGGAETSLALTARHGETVIASQRVHVETLWTQFRFKANFLSTRGNGHIRVTALDGNGQSVASLGWVVVGDMPAGDASVKWFDLRVPQNYLGGWLERDVTLTEQFTHEFPGVDQKTIRDLQVDFIVSDGQHGLVSNIALLEQKKKGIVLKTSGSDLARTLGEEFSVSATIKNLEQLPQHNIHVRAVEPFGWGLVVAQPLQTIETLAPGEEKILTWKITAQRPSAVNLGKPWELAIHIEGGGHVKAPIIVKDPHPGRIFYVLTDDLEPIDGAGYAKAFGNQNAWLDPEEFRVQLIDKAQRLDRIAETYGAKWSHYIAWPAVTAAEWAAKQSTTGSWSDVVEELKQSVRNEAGRGHEYAIHMHSDYDPRFPGNILRYNAASDGFWANHRRHGWAHTLPELGTFADSASRTGSLYEYHARLTELMRASAQGQIIATRVGSFDFGDTPAEEAKSLEAYRRVGLMAGSDADGNIGGVTAGDFQHSIYITAMDDINKAGGDLRNIGILQFRPNPTQYIAYDTDSAAILNKKVADGVSNYSINGQIVPGVHAIVGFTHTMFVMGEGDWRSTTGGQFAEIENHLSFVQNTFGHRGIVTFATSSEMAKEYWDYYTPELRAVYGAEENQGRGKYVYPIRLLGKQIPVDQQHVHTVSVKYPLYLRDSAYKIEIRKNNQVVYTTWGLPTPFNDISFRVDDANAEYSLCIYTDPLTGKFVKAGRWIKGKLLGMKNFRS